MRDDAVASAWVPSECTLPTEEQPMRLEEFDAVFRAALSTVDRTGRTRLMLTFQQAACREEYVRDLTHHETQCCSFFTFTLTGHDDLLFLEVAVPSAHADVLDGIAERAIRVSGLAT